MDPYACPVEIKSHYGFNMSTETTGKYDAVVMAVSHKEYVPMGEKEMAELSTPRGIIFDIKGIMRDRITTLEYTSL